MFESGDFSRQNGQFAQNVGLSVNGNFVWISENFGVNDLKGSF